MSLEIFCVDLIIELMGRYIPNHHHKSYSDARMLTFYLLLRVTWLFEGEKYRKFLNIKAGFPHSVTLCVANCSVHGGEGWLKVT